MCWPYFTTTKCLRNLHYVSCKRNERRCFVLRLQCLRCFKHGRVWGIYLDVDCNSCGQTSRPVVKTEIQTCRNVKASPYGYNLFLVNMCCERTSVVLARRYFQQDVFCRHSTLLSNVDLLLREDLPETTTATGTDTKPCRSRTTERRREKTVSTILWVQLALVVCYVPFGIVAGIGINNGVVWLATSNLIFLNSSLNPILYCWKIKEVGQKVKDTIRQLYCC